MSYLGTASIGRVLTDPRFARRVKATCTVLERHESNMAKEAVTEIVYAYEHANLSVPSQNREELVEIDQLRADAAELAGILIDLLDRCVISGVHQRERIGSLPALGRANELREAMRGKE